MGIHILIFPDEKMEKKGSYPAMVTMLGEKGLAECGVFTQSIHSALSQLTIPIWRLIFKGMGARICHLLGRQNPKYMQA